MKIHHYVTIVALALTALGPGTSLLAQQAGDAPDSAAAPEARGEMPMMEHGDGQEAPGMRGMMTMMRQCMKMMDSMGMETGMMPMRGGPAGDSTASAEDRGMEDRSMKDGPMVKGKGAADGAEADSVPERS
jgi:hypothetical protein